MKITRILFVFAWILMLVVLLFNPLMSGFGDFLAKGSAQQTIVRYPSQLMENFTKRRMHYIPYTQIPVCAKEGIVSVEDRRFYQNEGIDLRAILRVLLLSFTNDHIDHGGSTLTQQLARHIIDEPRSAPNIFVGAISLLRVFHYTLIVNHDFSKKKIIELYLNSVYFGKKANGIAQAAQAYFHTDIHNLTLGQCLYLTGLPQAPSIFGHNPGGQAAMDRYRHVLATMVRNQYLSSAYARELSEENLFAGSTP